MDAVFTIVAKNYLAHARTLGDSLKQLYPELPFYVVLADDTEGQLDIRTEPYTTVGASELGIEGYREMAFKYDLVEFATAIKPSVFEYLFARRPYDRIIYFDPDIFVYDRLDPIFDALRENFMVLTPHMTKIGLSGGGAISEETILFVGTYNLGFVAFRRDERSFEVIRWWRDRLRRQGYADRLDALHVDQKWMDLIPAFFDEGVRISRHPGLNVAHWNMHERELVYRAGRYYLDGEPLVFLHYSGFDPRRPDSITGEHKQSLVTLDNMPEYRPLFTEYAKHLASNTTASASLGYSFGKFSNGVRIYSFQRRLFRRLLQEGVTFGDPFATTPGSFYDMLRRHRLLLTGSAAGGEFNQRNVANAGRKLKLLRGALLLLKKVVGIKYYHLLMRTLAVLSRPEEQIFLLESLDLDLKPRFGAIPGASSSR
jgi:hypothetical protein